MGRVRGRPRPGLQSARHSPASAGVVEWGVAKGEAAIMAVVGVGETVGHPRACRRRTRRLCTRWRNPTERYDHGFGGGLQLICNDNFVVLIEFVVYHTEHITGDVQEVQFEDSQG